MEEVSVFSETIASFLIHHLPEPLVSQPKCANMPVKHSFTNMIHSYSNRLYCLVCQ